MPGPRDDGKQCLVITSACISDDYIRMQLRSSGAAALRFSFHRRHRQSVLGVVIFRYVVHVMTRTAQFAQMALITNRNYIKLLSAYRDNKKQYS